MTTLNEVTEEEPRIHRNQIGKDKTNHDAAPDGRAWMTELKGRRT